MSFITTKINEQLYEFTELSDLAGNGVKVPYVDAYLLIGTKRAALIDALQYSKGLYEEVRKYTDLPLDILITHGHGDHAGCSLKEFADAGCKIYMCMEDYDSLLQMSPFVEKRWLTDMKDGDIYELGGITLETIACAGHTAGSVVFLERHRQWLFSGDTIGSGSFWLQIPGSLPICRFEENVGRLWEKLKAYSKLLIFPGHRNQTPGLLTLDYVSDCLYIARGLVEGTVKGEDRILDLPGRHMEFKTAAHGQMLDFCYDPKHIQ